MTAIDGNRGGVGVGVMMMPTPERGDGWGNLECDTCDYQWVGPENEPCPGCCRRWDLEPEDAVGLLTARSGHDFVPITAWRSEAIRWAWQDMIPLGEMTLLAGMEKAGKSLLCCELVARASRGQLDGDLHGVPVRCLYLTAEDRVGHVIKPRLDLAGADLDNVLVQAPDDNLVVTLGAMTAAMDDGIRLIVLDPLVAYLDGLDDERAEKDVRDALGPIIKSAQQRGVAIVAIKHLNKSSGKAALDRISGSRGYTAAVRSIIWASDDPESSGANPDRLLHARGNLAPSSVGQRYGIEAHPVTLDDGEVRDHPQIIWKGTSDATLEDSLVGAERDADDAPQFLRRLLSDGPMIARHVYEEGEQAGFSVDQLKRAKGRAGVISDKSGGPGEPWYWVLKEGR